MFIVSYNAHAAEQYNPSSAFLTSLKGNPVPQRHLKISVSGVGGNGIRSGRSSSKGIVAEGLGVGGEDMKRG